MSAVPRFVPDRETTTTGLIEQYEKFAILLSTLDTSMWAAPTRCTGWQVRDIAAHVVAQAADVVGGTVGARSPDEQAASLRAHTPDDLATQLREISRITARLTATLDDGAWSQLSPLPQFTVGRGMHALVHDSYVHADDIRAALGEPYDDGPGLRASLDFVLGELSRDRVAASESRIAPLLQLPTESFTQHSGFDMHEFVLVATGRRDPRTCAMPDTVNIFRQ